ncbi:MAG: hypothetical protein OEW39_00285 [Deltaproteobacteria bacterium]|nr:hypothetical protein [Deltaproteobacteria bacterium]
MWILILAMAPLVVLVMAMVLLSRPAWQAGMAALIVLAPITVLNQDRVPWQTVWAGAIPDTVLLAGTVAYTLIFGLLLHPMQEHSGGLALLPPVSWLWAELEPWLVGR